MCVRPDVERGSAEEDSLLGPVPQSPQDGYTAAHPLPSSPWRPSMSNRSQFFISAFALLAALVPTSAPSAAITPEAAKVVNRYIAAVGGLAAVQAEQTVHSKNVMKAYGFTGTVEQWTQRPDKIASHMALGPITLKDGFDGTTA